MTLLSLQVFAEGKDQEVIHSDKKMTASATKSEEHSYLSLEVEHQFLQPGEALKVTLRDITPQGAAKPTFIYFMVRTISSDIDVVVVVVVFIGFYQRAIMCFVFNLIILYKIIISTTGLE